MSGRRVSREACWWALCVFFVVSIRSYSAGWVTESAREVPVVAGVDVVIVGGATGGVAAALAASEAGAEVLLLARRPYLGGDMCAPLRLWLQPGEKPVTELATAVFSGPEVMKGLRFSYAADQPSAERHADTDPPAMLTDGQWGTAFTQSVQYNEDVNITADLGEPCRLSAVRLMYFQGKRNYEVGNVAVYTSVDGTVWQPAGAVYNPHAEKGNWVEAALTLEMPLDVSARYVRVFVQKAEGANRLLLGELQVHAEQADEGEAPGHVVIPPLHVKRVLEDALLDADVPFYYGCYVTDVLTDRDGHPAGVVMVNRGGRQAVRGKVVVDASARAWVTRQAGHAFRAYPSGDQSFIRVVAGGAPCRGPGVSYRSIALARSLGGVAPARYGSGGFGETIGRVNAAMTLEYDTLLCYTLQLPIAAPTFAAFCEAEQLARDQTFDPNALLRADSIYQVPPDSVVGEESVQSDWKGADDLPLGVFQPRGSRRLFVLGGCADISRQAAERLVRPVALMATGRRIGVAAAAEARAIGDLEGVALRGEAETSATKGDVKEVLRGLRPTDRIEEFCRADRRSIRVLGEYDVVVAGGGTSGAPAAIGAARAGAKTLVVEYLTDLGGVGTTGMIGVYCAGYRKGFTAEVEAGIAGLGCPSYVDGKMAWWRQEIRRAGGDIWLGTLACGAFVEQGRVKGLVVATPEQRGVVLADVVIDATGNGDVAVAAGATSMYVDASTVAMQGAGLPRKPIGASYVNTDWTYVDETDMLDVRGAFVAAKKRCAGAWDIGQLIDTRERRRILGDYVLSPLDIVNRRTFPDTVGISQGGRLDSHGFTIHPYYLINNHLGGISYTPYRCLLPKGLDGILVVGLAISAHRDAIPSLRMQPCMQNLGYAAGRAAAMAAEDQGRTRDIDLKALQEHLVATTCLTPEVPDHKDSYPFADATLKGALEHLQREGYQQLGIIMASWDRARPMLQTLYADLDDPAGRLRCAHVLGIMGDDTGFECLVNTVRSADSFDTGRIDRYFPCVTWLDSYIIALGRTRRVGALPAVLEKLSLLGQGNGAGFSHYRAVCEALEQIGDPTAARPLAELLQRSGGEQQVVTDSRGARKQVRGRGGIRNLIIARVLYRCGDWNGVGQRVLEAYAGDVRGVYARHAVAVLERQPGESTRPAGWVGR